MKRIGFLPLFFLVLGVAFAIAVFVRVRSHGAPDKLAARQQVVMSEGVQAVPGAGAVADQVAEPAPAARPDYNAPPLLDRAPAPVASHPSASAAPPRVAPPPTVTAFPAAANAPEAAPSAAMPPRTATAPAQRTDPAPEDVSQRRPGSAQSSSPPARERTTGGDPAAEADPTSDSTPPQLLSIEFAPPQVADGEQTLLIASASDDLSGVRSVSGTIVGPSGAVQGFAAQRDEAGRFIARIVVPKDAAEGTWSVNYLNLMDNASNAASLSAVRGGLPPTASFRVVSSRPDAEGPTLDAIWVDRRSMRGGEKNVVFVRAHDDKSGVNLVSGIFQSPARSARLGFVCRSTGDALWSCEVTAPTCADCGEWQLEQLQMQDKANNMTTLRAPQHPMLAPVRIDVVSDMCDNTPPELQSIALDQSVVSNADQSTILVTVRLNEDACGVLSVSGQAIGPQTTGVPPRLYYSFMPGGDPQTWVARLVVPRLAAKGLWRVSFLQVLDRGQNLRTYTQNDPLLASATFLVQ